MRIVPREQFELASITVSELLVGVYRASLERREGRERFVERAIERYPVLPFDLVVARRHAELWAELAAAGRMIGPHDMQVAATALAHVIGCSRRTCGSLNGCRA